MVTCLNVYSDDLLSTPLQITGGNAAVPQGPGLGVTVDEEALERYRVDPSHQPETPRRLIVVYLANGSERVYTDFKDLRWEPRDRGWTVVQPTDARLEITTDDGSADFDRAYAQASAR